MRRDVHYYKNSECNLEKSVNRAHIKGGGLALNYSHMENRRFPVDTENV